MFRLPGRFGICGGVASVLVSLVLFSVVSAEVPRMMHYQGRLTDTLGIAMDTKVNLTFGFFEDSAGTSQLWTEKHESVTVEDGLFSVLLGSVTPIDPEHFNGATLWLGIAVDEGDFMMPLTPMVSTAYAFGSSRADHAATAGHADTADIALGSSGNGWLDTGNDVYLQTITDSVGIGTTSPRAPLEVQGGGHAIIGESQGNGTAAGVYGANGGDGFGIMGVSNYGRGVTGLSVTGFGGHFYGAKNYFNKNLGIGTETPDEMLHIYNEAVGANSLIKVQSNHVSSWGETGLRFETPQNTWHFRMDDNTNDNMPAGGLSLRSQSLDAEVMTWAEDGRVGIGDLSAVHRFSVYSNDNAIMGSSTGSGVGIYGYSKNGFGGYFVGARHYFNGLTGFGTTDPTHRLTVNGTVGLQQSATTKFHLGYYNNGFNISETSIADYRLYIKEGGNVGIGTGNPQSKLDVNGTITADGMLSTSLTDEAGLAAGLGGSSDYLGGSWQTVRSRTIGVPGPGYVVAISAGYAYVEHTVSGVDKLEYGISAVSSDLPEERKIWLRFADNANAGNYWIPVSANNVFEVTSAGDHTYYLLARRAEGDNHMWVAGCSLILMYFPTAYGTVTTTAKNDETSPPPPMPTVSAEAVNDVSTSTLSQRIEALSDELELLRDVLKTMDEK